MNTHKYIVVPHLLLNLTDKNMRLKFIPEKFLFGYLSELSEKHRISSSASYSFFQLYEYFFYTLHTAEMTGPAKGKP